LDLYAGTGSLGIEALSRGAKMAVFIDKNQRAIQTIKKNLLTFAIQQKVLTYKENILKGFSYLKDSFEVIFMDPPYEKGYVEKTLYLIDAKVRLLKKQGLIIIEHSAKENFSFIDFSLIVCRQYGQTMITFLRKE
jgi:16S rRNA (guanine966-N2)-methyltransferase